MDFKTPAPARISKLRTTSLPPSTTSKNNPFCSPTQPFFTPYDVPLLKNSQTLFSSPRSPLSNLDSSPIGKVTSPDDHLASKSHSKSARGSPDNTASRNDLVELLSQAALRLTGSGGADHVVLRDLQIFLSPNNKARGCEVDLRAVVDVLQDSWTSIPLLSLPFLVRSFHASRLKTEESVKFNITSLSGKYKDAHVAISNSMLSVMTKGHGSMLYTIKLWVPFAPESDEFEQRLVLKNLPLFVTTKLQISQSYESGTKSLLPLVEPRHIVASRSVPNTNNESSESESPFTNSNDTTYRLFPTDFVEIIWRSKGRILNSEWDASVMVPSMDRGNSVDDGEDSKATSSQATVTSTVQFTRTGHNVKFLDIVCGDAELDVDVLSNLRIEGECLHSWTILDVEETSFVESDNMEFLNDDTNAFKSDGITDSIGDTNTENGDSGSDIFSERPPPSLVKSTIARAAEDDNQSALVSIEEEYGTAISTPRHFHRVDIKKRVIRILFDDTFSDKDGSLVLTFNIPVTSHEGGFTDALLGNIVKSLRVPELRVLGSETHRWTCRFQSPTNTSVFNMNRDTYRITYPGEPKLISASIEGKLQLDQVHHGIIRIQWIALCSISGGICLENDTALEIVTADEVDRLDGTKMFRFEKEDILVVTPTKQGCTVDIPLPDLKETLPTLRWTSDEYHDKAKVMIHIPTDEGYELGFDGRFRWAMMEDEEDQTTIIFDSKAAQEWPSQALILGTLDITRYSLATPAESPLPEDFEQDTTSITRSRRLSFTKLYIFMLFMTFLFLLSIPLAVLVSGGISTHELVNAVSLLYKQFREQIDQNLAHYLR